ncbi:deoxyhypusine synthase Dys [Methanobrevibacter ruminantium M1]|uniref:Deoxyhypusine synthase Dys n=1 Tax=Methanobrevibacter ruminantium (strain ATCC 35063 / DSM 1093 / JCM 13430 / OCM 146 / M1) TaxID=634498 RepID=D3E2Z3_METRM|nr:deoxyhypusine synthase [Methanobrevibacter ruminantium]ADC46904.1 deoxyhypusine synthase Dys [Methanobrevibacter ruminantium M1]
MKVNQISIKKDMKVSELMEEFKGSGVLGAGRVARASNLLVNMINDPDMDIFMSMAGPLVPGGLRYIVGDLIRNKRIKVLITSGANITHDLLESFGGRHYRDLGFNDEELNDAGIGRISDVYTQSEDFEVFESEIIKIFETISKKIDNDKDNGIISIQRLLKEVGSLIEDENSILRLAYENDVSIFAPGLIDSMFGLQLWMFTQDHKLVVDAVGDMHYLSDLVFESDKIGAIMLGGGLPKHYTLASNLLKGGIDSGLQITMDRPETGSLSGAPLEEAKSWSKAKHGSNLVTVVGDATALFPLIYAAALDKID